MVLIAIANGALRELWYRKYVGELQAHQISTILAVLLFAVYISGLSPSNLLHDYNLLAGRIWVLIPLWIMVAPSLFCRLRRQ